MKTNEIKRLAILLIFSFVFLITSCSKENTYKVAEVTKNCTGTYIITDDKTYLVCNEQILGQNKEGDKIEVKFKLIGFEECKKNGYDPAGCYLGFKFDDQIEISKIK